MLIKQDVTYNTIPDYPINYSYENYYDGTMLIRRTSSGVDAWFDYDESGSPVGMNVTTTTGSSSNPTVTTTQYYFVKNLQGDIVAIADATGEIQFTYTYDSWGKVLSTKDKDNFSPLVFDTSSPANINPFRYRGYYYDAENEIYWLQSRFYDPSTGRFLNADGYVTTGQGILSTNMFLYCGNNPVNRLDSNGEFFLTATACGIIGLTLLLFAGTAIILEETAKNPPLIPPISPPCLDIKLKIKENTLDLPKLDEKEKDITVPDNPKKQAYFTINPYDFTPKGLIMKEFTGTKNGRIIEWRDPISQAKIFEWDEDLRYGSHYHAMMVEWDGDHQQMHYLPNTPVPEPWNSIYF